MLLSVLAVAVPTQAPAPRAYLDAAVNGAIQILGVLECKDLSENCAGWAKGGECRNNPGFMHSECRKACNVCELSHADADGVLEIGLYMTRNFRAACIRLYDTVGLYTAAAQSLCDASTEMLSSMLRRADEKARRSKPFDGKALSEYLVATADVIKTRAPSELAPFVAKAEAPVAAATGAKAGGASPPARSSFSFGSSGLPMPAVGLGTWLMTGDACYEMVLSALRAGFRHIDTSENYANHEAIGRAIAAAAVPRSELFIADKVSFPTSYSAAGVRAMFASSSTKLGVAYLDLLMLHSVGPSAAARREAWGAMEALVDEGKVRHLGVSNFDSGTLADLVSYARVKPVTVQNKFNVYHQGGIMNAATEDLAAASARLGVTVVAYCPLNAWPSKLAPVGDAHVARIAARLGRTPAQVLLRWAVQRGAAALTRSTKEGRLREALQVYDFELSAGDMATLSGLAHLVASPVNKPPPTVEDALGVAALDAGAKEGASPARASDDTRRVEL